MGNRLRVLSDRFLPNGWIDILRQLLIFGVAYYGYRLVPGAIDQHTRVETFEHASDIIGVERSLHLFIEPSFQSWAIRDAPWLNDFASWMYLNAHLPLM